MARGCPTAISYVGSAPLLERRAALVGTTNFDVSSGLSHTAVPVQDQLRTLLRKACVVGPTAHSGITWISALAHIVHATADVRGTNWHRLRDERLSTSSMEHDATYLSGRVCGQPGKRVAEDTDNPSRIETVDGNSPPTRRVRDGGTPQYCSRR